MIKALKTAAAVDAAITLPLTPFITDDPQCVPYYWYTVSRNPDNTAPIPGIPGS
ncbi:hypothetical protein [Mycobacterium sp.]|uniref:hypothetical protein n=1 Tax=Mycobacterium sp. TaxID=1785 RepID=UPI003C716DD6